MPLYAITRCLEIISEASRRLLDELKARHPHIPWREMAAAGNFYRHKYENVLPRRVWKMLQQDLPLLRAVIGQELAGRQHGSGGRQPIFEGPFARQNHESLDKITFLTIG
jgi:uncharacterized protein with HEPN domain